MKINGWLVLMSACLFGAFAAFAQTPPPNDNYSNRTVLTGTDLTFTGTLAGATLENTQEAVWYNDFFGTFNPATQSVWWSWTAPETSVMTLQLLSSSLPNSIFYYSAGIVVYNATNGSISPDGLILPPLAAQGIFFVPAPPSVSIPVTAGTEYLIQLVGRSSGSFTTRLIATNVPIILQHPRSRTVNSNSTVLFYVIAASTNQTNLAFQWLSNGIPLPNETAPMFALSNVDSGVAGPYSVMVSNSAGATFSEPAMLVVSQSNAPITLAANGTQSNLFKFSVNGETGRYYRIQTSTDLTNWTPDQEFLKESFGPNYTSVVYGTNSPFELLVPQNLPRRYFRASPYLPPTQAVDQCINHLEQIRVAKLLWARDVNVFSLATPQPANLLPYFPRHIAPVCPLDGVASFTSSYTINAVGTDPGCIIQTNTHRLETPR